MEGAQSGRAGLHAWMATYTTIKSTGLLSINGCGGHVMISCVHDKRMCLSRTFFDSDR
jgi:hypothetical protein